MRGVSSADARQTFGEPGDTGPGVAPAVGRT